MILVIGSKPGKGENEHMREHDGKNDIKFLH